MAQRVQRGQDNPLLQASVINDVLDAVDAYKLARLGDSKPPTGSAINWNRVRVKNLSGANLARGAALQLGTYMLTSGVDSRRAWFQGNAVTSLSGNLAIATQPIQTNQFGEAAVAGICTARVNFGSTTDQYASFATSSTTLTSGASGPVKILQAPSSTGVQEVWVQFVAPASTSVVQIDTTNTIYTGSGSPSAGQLVKCQSDGTFSIKLASAGSSGGLINWSASGSAWLAFVDVPLGSASSSPAPAAVCGDQYDAVLLGTWNGRTLYGCRRGRGKAKIISGTCAAFNSQTPVTGNYGTVTVGVSIDGASPGTTVVGYDYTGIFMVPTGQTRPCLCLYAPESDAYAIIQMGC